MHAMSSYENSGSKVTKIAIVTALHLALGLALVNMTITKEVTHENGPIMFDPGVAPPPPPPPEPVDAPAPTATPTIFVPRTDFDVQPTPNTPTLTTSNVPATPPTVVGPAVVTPPVTPPPVVVAPKGVYMPALASASNCALPDYPARSARNGDTGTVGLALLIAPNGQVADAKVTSTSGFRELDHAALAALSLCKFKPATNNGVPESAWGKIAYVWTLEQ